MIYKIALVRIEHKVIHVTVEAGSEREADALANDMLTEDEGELDWDSAEVVHAEEFTQDTSLVK